MPHLHEVTFPDKYDLASAFADKKLGNVETNSELSDPKKLALYALRNYVDKGKCTDPCPSMFYLRERYKYQAWKAVESMNKFEAMVQYVDHLEEVVGRDWVEEALGDAPAPAEQGLDDVGPPDANGPTQPPSLATSSVVGIGSGPIEPKPSTVGGPDDNEPASPVTEPEIEDPISDDLHELQGEVRRLRFLLQESGIDHRTGAPLPPKQYQAILRGGAKFLPPPAASNFPGSSRPAPSVAPSRSEKTPSTAQSTSASPKVVVAHVVADRPRLTQPAVYYGASPEGQRVGWLEWLGLSSSGNGREMVKAVPAQTTAPSNGHAVPQKTQSQSRSSGAPTPNGPPAMVDRSGRTVSL